MMDGDDHDLLRAWRGEAREAPGDLLDRRILRAAEAQRRRRRALPLAAAMAACLVLALYAVRPQQLPAPASQPNKTIAYQNDTTALLADPEAMRQMMIRQMPGGSSNGAAF